MISQKPSDQKRTVGFYVRFTPAEAAAVRAAADAAESTYRSYPQYIADVTLRALVPPPVVDRKDAPTSKT